MAAGVLNEEERFCSPFDVYSTDESEVDLAQIPHNHVDDLVVVNVELVSLPGTVFHLNLMNSVAKNLSILLSLDPEGPGIRFNEWMTQYLLLCV